MTQYIISLISDFIGSSASTIDSFLKDLFYFVFYIEKQFVNAGINFDTIYKLIYEWAIIILIIVFIKKMIQTYFLWKTGDDDVSPIHVLLGVFEAITIMICFGWLYTFVINIAGSFFEQLMTSIDRPNDFSTSSLIQNSSNGLFSAIISLVLVIEFLILIFQFIHRGFEILIMRCIVPFTCIGLLSSNGGSFSIIIKKFTQNILTVILQLTLMFITMKLAGSGHLIYAVACRNDL